MSEIGTHVYRIAKGQTKAYAKVMAMEALRVVPIVYAAFVLLFFILLSDKLLALGVAGAFIILFAIVGLIVYLARLSGAEHMAKAAQFTLNDEIIALDHDRNKLSGFIKFGAARNEMRSGETIDRCIRLDDIGSTIMNKNGTVIKSKTYNMFLDPNGRIFVPAQIERYEEFKNIILNNKTRFKHG